MSELEEKVLTVINYGVEEDGLESPRVTKTRVTIAPGMVQVVVGSYDTYKIVEEIELRKVNVLFLNDNDLELFISLLDLTILERAIGTYNSSLFGFNV